MEIQKRTHLTKIGREETPEEWAGGVGGWGGSLIHEGAIFIFCLLPPSSQCTAAGGYGDGERGQWDRHRGLLATPSRRGAERGGPGVQGNNKTAAQQLPEVCERGNPYCLGPHKRDTNRPEDGLDNKGDVQTWEGNEFEVEAHLRSARGFLAASSM